MFSVLHSEKKIVKILLPLFLALITLPFIVTGVLDFGVSISRTNRDVASVGDAPVSVLQFEDAIREEQKRLRNQFGDAFKLEMMNEPAIRIAILNNLIERQLLLSEAGRNKLRLSDDVLKKAISEAPTFQINGKFSDMLYREFLASRGLAGEAMIRDELTMQQYLGVVLSSFVSNAQADAFLRLRREERRFHEARISAESFLPSVTVSGEEARKYYDDHPARFEDPEKIKVEYVVLSQEAMLPQVEVPESEIKARYDARQDRYRQGEERRARHILIKAENADKKAGAREKAAKILAEAQKSPLKFAEIARRYSDDTLSAKNGGDLDFFPRGAMVKPFEEAVFDQLKKNEISGLVESDYGYHIIQLTDIKPEKVRPFAEARQEIEDELKRQTLARKFAESAEAFGNMVYEQSDSLQAVAENFKLKRQATGWIDRKSSAQWGELANNKLIERLFSKDAIQTRQNIETVEIAPGQFLAARVIDHEAAKQRPFESEKIKIENELRFRKALDLAQQEGERILLELKQGLAMSAPLAWSAEKSVTRDKTPTSALTPDALVGAVFKAGADKLPGYAGFPDGAGYRLVRLVGVSVPETPQGENAAKSVWHEYNALAAQQEWSAIMDALRKRYPVKTDLSKILVQEN